MMQHQAVVVLIKEK